MGFVELVDVTKEHLRKVSVDMLSSVRKIEVGGVARGGYRIA
jgi:hypothetical protein